MNREAAILQTPVISCYPGKTLAVDQYYIDQGLMFRSNDIDEVIQKENCNYAKNETTER